MKFFMRNLSLLSLSLIVLLKKFDTRWRAVKATLVCFILMLTFGSFPIKIFASETVISNPNLSSIENCPIYSQAASKIQKWALTALHEKNSIGCPQILLNSELFKLESLAQKKNTCGQKAKAQLLAFYSFFSNDPTYAMCGLRQREEKLISEITEDGKICSSSTRENIDDCFSKILAVISDLKMRGENKQYFELAKKTADSNDVTGISQLMVATAYQFGNGTTKNLVLSIEWYKKALEKLTDNNQRKNALLGIGEAYEDSGKYKEASYYYTLGSQIGDVWCKAALLKLSNLALAQKIS